MRQSKWQIIKKHCEHGSILTRIFCTRTCNVSTSRAHLSHAQPLKLGGYATGDIKHTNGWLKGTGISLNNPLLALSTMRKSGLRVNGSKSPGCRQLMAGCNASAETAVSSDAALGVLPSASFVEANDDVRWAVTMPPENSGCGNILFGSTGSW